jgi:hypothetical protein
VKATLNQSTDILNGVLTVSFPQTPAATSTLTDIAGVSLDRIFTLLGFNQTSFDRKFGIPGLGAVSPVAASDMTLAFNPIFSPGSLVYADNNFIIILLLLYLHLSILLFVSSC